MKKVLAILMVLAMLFAFAACTADNTASGAGDDASADSTSDLAYVQGKGKMVIGVTVYEPMNYQENGKWTGFDTEFAEAFCKELGVEAEFLVIDWDNKIQELDSKAIDCIWNGMTILDEITKNASVSDPYVKNAQVVVMKSSEISKYADFAAMKDLKFAAESESAGAKLLEEAKYDVTAMGDQAAALLEVSTGAADACVIDITMAQNMTGEGTSYANLGIAAELNTEEYGVAFRKGSDLTAKLNSFMATAKTDGTLDALATKYKLTLVK